MRTFVRLLVASAWLISVASASKFVGPTEFVLEVEITAMHKKLPPEVQEERVHWTVGAGAVAQTHWTKVVKVVDPWAIHPPETYLPSAIYVACPGCKVGQKLSLRLTRGPLVEGKMSIIGVVFGAKRVE